ncbi:preprotein translocase subunit YajC [Persephonella atlantica]|uniref:Sec translocon accessory complex subunit YajC n=1 Tax=Persephonella atlantica TaxID=2699429 RepID=A0ABS1GJQ8_9AQUI|nr:preprotein translocase subunit YajC [Persephonella atlantica]MBK3333174.1 preprotein translocase subunit YajC [Persephonella atlantica]
MQGTDPMSSIIGAVLWMVILIAIFYFLLYRPQQQQRKKHQEFINSLKKGDKVVTSGGIIGEIKAIDEKTVTLKVSEGTMIKVLKTAVSAPFEEVEKKD